MKPRNEMAQRLIGLIAGLVLAAGSSAFAELSPEEIRQGSKEPAQADIGAILKGARALTGKPPRVAPEPAVPSPFDGSATPQDEARRLKALRGVNRVLMLVNFKRRSGEIVRARVTAKRVEPVTDRSGLQTLSFHDPRIEVDEYGWLFPGTRTYRISGYSGRLDTQICKRLTGLSYVSRNLNSFRWLPKEPNLATMDDDGTVRIFGESSPIYIESMTCTSDDSTYE